MKSIVDLFLLENGIPSVSIGTNYWFVRSNGGEFFDRFFTQGYIAIEWDEISDLNKIANSNVEDLKEEVKKIYPKETRPGLITTYLTQFVREMKPGDIVLVPGKNSDIIAFGKITSDAYKYEPAFEEEDSRGVIMCQEEKPTPGVPTSTAG